MKEQPPFEIYNLLLMAYIITGKFRNYHDYIRPSDYTYNRWDEYNKRTESSGRSEFK